MRALCGAIITAGALIGLGIAALGLGTRYHDFPRVDKEGNETWVRFWHMDTPLIAIVILLICTVVVGLGIAILGLAYHHERRHRERLRELDPAQQPNARIET